MNTLFYGDNLDVLRNKVDDASVDLCYIDPPFNSKRSYVQIYNNMGEEDRAQSWMYADTWTWNDEARNGYAEILANKGQRFAPKTVALIRGLRDVLTESPLLAYLVSLTLRVTEIHRVLKPTGSFFLHCDPTASHYIKLILDGIFVTAGGDFKNEIVWHYKKWSVRQKQFVSNHDVIFFYTKSDAKERVWNQPFMPRAASTRKRFGTAKIISGYDASGKRIPSQKADIESEGVPRDDVWNIGRVPPIKQLFPTQKPEKLLRRIIAATTNPGDVVLDAYCGCGTTVVVTEEMKEREWIGIDITYQAISVILFRLEQQWGKKYVEETVMLDGIPRDMESARALATKRRGDKLRKEFEKWAVLTYTDNGAIVHEKKSADRGIDGVAYFYSRADETSKIIFQVKSGNVGRGDVAKLSGDMQREGAAVAVLLTLEEPSRNMRLEAKAAGPYVHPLTGKTHDKIKIVTIREMLERKVRIDLPLNLEVMRAFQRTANAKQLELKLVAPPPEKKLPQSGKAPAILFQSEKKKPSKG
jgi:DNA modification methylase